MTFEALVPLGYRKNGRAIFPIRGGSIDTLPLPGAPAPGSTVTIPAPVPTPPAPSGNVFTAEQLADALAKARKEEKDKLYPELEGTRNNLKTLQDEVAKITQARDVAAAAEQKALEDALAEAKAKADAEASAKDLLAQQKAEFEERFSRLDTEREQERAVFAKEKAFNELQQYIQRRVTEESQSIAPELVPFITGNTVEEVEASIATTKTATENIVKSLRDATITARSQQNGVSPTLPATGPLDNQPGTLTFTAEELKNMSMAEYAKYRNALLPSASPANRGMFS